MADFTRIVPNTHIRQFAPAFMDTFIFRSNDADDPLINALSLLRQLNAENRRKIPDDAPLDFIPAKWEPYIFTPNNNIDRHYYELCALWELKNSVRSGDIWVDSSRRFANPESYLIPQSTWPELRPEVCRQIEMSDNPIERLAAREAEAEEMLDRMNNKLSENGNVRMEKGRFVVTPLEGEDRPESAVRLSKIIDQRLPRVDLVESHIIRLSFRLFSRIK